MKASLQNREPQSADQLPQPKGVAMADAGPRQQRLKEFSALAAGSPRGQHLRTLSAQLHDGPRLTAQRKLNASCQAKPVVQRLVEPGLAEGTPVVIKRSTSREFHGAEAKIVESGPGPNEYIVSVGEQLLIARLDQLLPSGKVPNAVGAEVEIDTIVNADPAQLLQEAREQVQELLLLTRPFVLGGSFAALIHALAAGQSARTPRDVDVIVDPADWKALNLGPKPVRTDLKIWGIPLELHRAGALVEVDKAEEATGIIGLNKLLAKALIKLRKQQFRFGEAIPGPGQRQSARGVLDEMEEANDGLMAMKDDEPDHMGANSKEVWVKTLADIRSLVDSGADLSVYNTGKKK